MFANLIDTGQAAAASALMLLRRYAPEAAEAAAPYLPRLFAALADGHAFVWLNEAEVAALADATPVVSRGGNTPLILDGRRLFLGRMWQLERDLAAEIVRLAQASTDEPNWMQAAHDLDNWFAGEGSEGQRDAAALALLQPFMLISGGPGTGKTTTVARLLALLCDERRELPRIALAAPTGKAAAHMAHALHNALDRFEVPTATRAHLLQLQGQTVHRLLKLRPPQMQPQFNAEQPLPLDILIVDEASMLDIMLLLHLLRAVPRGCRVVLLGDENQLPSVGAGAILAALAQTTQLNDALAQKLYNIVPRHAFQTASAPPPLSQNVARLLVSHRFGEESGIGCLARAVVAEDAEAAWAQFGRFPKALSVRMGGSREQAEELYALQANYWAAVDAGDVAEAFARQGDIVVLAAWRDDAETFNQAYRRCLQQHGRAIGDTPWFAGQILMIERNDYALNVFNGDIGLVLADESGALSAWFAAGEGHRNIPLSRLSSHITAFAMTVHKSQGSEYREVWLLPPSLAMPSESSTGLSKALLYTAITRASQRFVFWGSQATFQAACIANEQRRSGLREQIGRAWVDEV